MGFHASSVPTLQDGLGRDDVGFFAHHGSSSGCTATVSHCRRFLGHLDDLAESEPLPAEALEAAAHDLLVEPCTVVSGDGSRLPWARLSGGPR